MSLCTIYKTLYILVCLFLYVLIYIIIIIIISIIIIIKVNCVETDTNFTHSCLRVLHLLADLDEVQG
jgi:hypothetical protein